MKRVQRIGHVTAVAALFIGKIRELTVDLTKKTVRVHDGVTPGGVPLAREDLTTTQEATVSTDGKMTAAQVAILAGLDGATLTAGFGIQITNPALADDPTIAVTLIPAGTKMLFMQAAAPTGWTQDVVYNDRAFRLVNTAGGGVGGTTNFSLIGAASVTGTSLTTSQIPSHIHSFSASTSANGSHFHSVYRNGEINSGAGSTIRASAASGSANTTTSTDGSHTHSVSGTTGSAGSGATHTHTLGLNIKYVDIIACAKDA